MKISVADFKKAVAVLERKYIDGVKSNINQWAIMAGFRNKNPQLDGLIEKMAVDGMIDVDAFRGFIDEGMEKCGGKLVIPANVPDWAIKIGVDIKDLTITKAEADDFFNNILPSASAAT
jgi:hypothetical protein